MADEKKPSEKTIEMRLAELEDKMSKIHITEDELKAYHKVNALIGGQQVAGTETLPPPSTALSPQICVIRPVAVSRPIHIQRGINECICGPCNCGTGGGGFGGGGFGGFGGG